MALRAGRRELGRRRRRLAGALFDRNVDTQDQQQAWTEGLHLGTAPGGADPRLVQILGLILGPDEE